MALQFFSVRKNLLNFYTTRDTADLSGIYPGWKKVDLDNFSQRRLSTFN